MSHQKRKVHPLPPDYLAEFLQSVREMKQIMHGKLSLGRVTEVLRPEAPQRAVPQRRGQG